jgi:hypothetical protein
MSDKGSPSEKMGRKATGLSPCFTGYGSRVAGQTQYLHGMYFARGINPSVAPPKQRLITSRQLKQENMALLFPRAWGGSPCFYCPGIQRTRKIIK